ncbi:MAG: AAA family ATPase, partial [Zoogloeaceae bacterium]|nr:AAA family ATPase [Zoogloeaceae bacterium]
MMSEFGSPTIKHAPARIRSVSIEGFRSLRDIQHLELPRLAVLIGANGSGKSSLIRFFEMLSWMLKSQKLEEFVLQQGGGDDQFFMGARKTPRIHAEIQLETGKGLNEYRFDLTHLSAGDTLMVLNEAYRHGGSTAGGQADWTEIGEVGKEAKLPDQANETARSICKLLCQCATYQFHDTSAQAPMRQRWDITDSVRLRSNGGNLAAVLLDLRENDAPRYKQLVWQIQRVFPALDDFVLEPLSGKVLLRWKSRYSDKIFGAHLTSDGSLRLFCLMTLLSLPDERLP